MKPRHGLRMRVFGTLASIAVGMIGCGPSSKGNSDSAVPANSVSQLAGPTIHYIDGTTIRIDAGLDSTAIIRAFRYHKAAWAMNGNPPAIVATVNVRNLTILPDGVNAGLAYFPQNVIDVVAYHSNYPLVDSPGVPIPYLYHEFGHLELRESSHQDSRWVRWNNEQAASNAAYRP